MPDRLSALDASFLYLEDPTTPMHVGTVLLFQQPRSTNRRPRVGRVPPRTSGGSAVWSTGGSPR